MIKSIRHRRLQRFYQRGDSGKIGAAYRDKVKRILTALDSARIYEDMNLPGFGMHALTGNLKGFWSVTVSSNWRIIFRLDENGVHDVDLIDYH